MRFSSRGFLAAEYLLLFAVFPAVLAAFKPHGWIYFVLWLVMALSCWTMEKHYDWNFRADWNFAALNRTTIKAILLRFLLCAAFLLIFTWVMIPTHLFSLPHDKPKLWLLVMLLYPPLSAVPQEIIFRSFIFRRFACVLSPRGLMVASAISFGWVHIVLLNWVAVVFSGAGGLLFAHTYSKTKSLAACCFEHALYGCYLFTIGMGYYFYHGQAVH